jgi:beta-glucuronidase
MDADDNANGKIDSPYDSYVDANKNNLRDAATEPVVGDFQLLKDMGANTIRIYHHPSNAPEVQAGYGSYFGTKVQFNHAPNKALLRDLYNTYGIRVMMGDYFGGQTIGSGADFNAGTDYRDPVQQQRMLASVQRMVLDFKDEPFLLMYVLGNENNYSFDRNVQKWSNDEIDAMENPEDQRKAKARIYYSFVNELAKEIKKIDSRHPVAMGVGETASLEFVRAHRAFERLKESMRHDTGFETNRLEFMLLRKVRHHFGHTHLVTEQYFKAVRLFLGLLRITRIRDEIQSARRHEDPRLGAFETAQVRDVRP